MLRALRRWGGWAIAALLVLSPLVLLIVRSLLGGDGAISLEHYRSLGEGRVLGLYCRTLLIASGSVVVSLIPGVGAALILESRRVPWRPLLRWLPLVPLLLPPYLQVAAWKPLLARIPAEALGLRSLLAALILGVSHSPYIFFFAACGIRSIPRSILDAARLQASEATVARRVILPLAFPAIAAGASLVFALSFLDQETPALLLLNTVATESFLQVSRGAGAAFAVGVPGCLALLALVFAATRWAERRGFAAAGGGPAGEFRSPGSVDPRPPAGIAAILLLVALGSILCAWPIARLLLLIRSPARFGEAWTLHGGALLEGLPLTIATALLALLLALLTVPWDGKPSRWGALLAWTSFLVPGAAWGIAWIELTNRPVLEAIYSSPAILALAGAARAFPISFHALAAHRRSVPRELREAIAVSPAGFWRRLFWARIPLGASGAALALAAVAILSSGELSAANLLAPPGHRPVPVAIASELHYNVDLEVPAALCLMQAVAVLAACLFLSAGTRILARAGPLVSRTVEMARSGGQRH